MYGLAHDVHNFSLLDDIRTLPWMLQHSGYRTALVGKKHVRPDALLPYDAWVAPELPGIRDVARMGHLAGQWMRAQGERPFFLSMGYSDPHRDSANFGNSRQWPEVEREIYSPSQVSIPAHLPDLPDNGRPFPGAKDNLYEPGLHLPLIIRSPEQRKLGVRNGALVSWIDVAPSILDWARISPPRDYRCAPLPGRSLLPILEQTDAAGFDRIFATHSFRDINQYYPMRSIRTRRYSYFLNLEPSVAVPVASAYSFRRRGRRS